jgi:release factor glutamine methyltransferase
MQYLHDLDIAKDDDVYPPSEDSILLVESFDVRQGERVLEIGCGSGIVSLHCALNGAEVSCGDINPNAVALARRNAEANGARLDVRETDIYSAFPERYDTVIFNLPYLPVEEEGLLAKAWSGGEDGMGPLPELLEKAPEYLLPGGRVIVVVSSLMDQGKLDGILMGRAVKELGKLPLFFEVLRVLEIDF